MTREVTHDPIRSTLRHFYERAKEVDRVKLVLNISLLACVIIAALTAQGALSPSMGGWGVVVVGVCGLPLCLLAVKKGADVKNKKSIALMFTIMYLAIIVIGVLTGVGVIC